MVKTISLMKRGPYANKLFEFVKKNGLKSDSVLIYDFDQKDFFVKNEIINPYKFDEAHTFTMRFELTNGSKRIGKGFRSNVFMGFKKKKLIHLQLNIIECFKPVIAIQ